MIPSLSPYNRYRQTYSARDRARVQMSVHNYGLPRIVDNPAYTYSSMLYVHTVEVCACTCVPGGELSTRWPHPAASDAQSHLVASDARSQSHLAALRRCVSYYHHCVGWANSGWFSCKFCLSLALLRASNCAVLFRISSCRGDVV